jgi:hypothetical protein
MDGEDLAAGPANPLAAMLAMQTASDLLSSASQRLAAGDCAGAFTEARDAMRMVSSALLLRDGYMAGTLEASLSYLESRYSGLLPLEAWREAELTVAQGSTVTGRFAALLGRNKRIDRKSTEGALAAALSFLSSARALLGVR